LAKQSFSFNVFNKFVTTTKGNDVTAIDRLTIYSVLCFVAFCALVFRGTAEVSLLPLIGLSAALIGIWLEMHRWHEPNDE